MARRLVLALVSALVLTGGVAAPAQGFSNGNLPESALAPINTGITCAKPANQLANQAAAGFNTMSLAAGKVVPVTGCDSAYRPFARQVYWRQYWCNLGQCGNAAVPGYSNHGLGLAIDVPQWVRGYIDQYGSSYGYSKSCSDAPQEWWHIKFCVPWDRPNPGRHLTAPKLQLGSGGPGQARWVKKAQKLLRKHGVTHLSADGDYGVHTRNAVGAFQHAQGIKSTGVVNRSTWRHLRRPVLRPKPHPTPPPTPKPHPPHPHHHHHGQPKPAQPVTGVDVSENNGSVDWNAVYHDGIRFAIVKATEGQDYRDKYFGVARLHAIVHAGLVPGVYHFLRPISSRAGAREAVWFAQVIGHEGYGKGMLQPVVDAEVTTLSPSGTCTYLHSFLHRIHVILHVKAIVYTFPSFAQTYLSDCGYLKHYPLWIANLGVSSPTIPAPWNHYLMWQFSWTGQISGISGGVDMDRLPGGTRKLVNLEVGAKPKLRRRVHAAVPAPKAAVTQGAIPKLAQKAPTPVSRAEVPAPEGSHAPPPPLLRDLGRLLGDLSLVN